MSTNSGTTNPTKAFVTLMRYFTATRPAFLSVTLVAVLIGFASAIHDNYPFSYVLTALTLIFALIAHAGANVLNDYFDALNGCDDAPSDRIFPYTGGSRFIQNGTLTQRNIGWFGTCLLISVVPVGLWLAAHSGWGLVLIGLLGLILGWGYSAPPMRLQSRGLGEWGITLSWLLVVLGADFVLRHAFAWTSVYAGLGFSLLVANLLFINQFPDVRADSAAGKNTLVVRLGPQRARWGYVLIALLSYGWILAMIALGRLPALALLSLAPALLSIQASRQLLRDAHQPALLAPAIQKTILATLAHGILIAIILSLHVR